MIVAEYEKDKKGYRLTVIGHADEKGSEEGNAVCSAVSSLTDTLASFLSANDEGVRSVLSKGYADITSTDRNAEKFFDFVYYGLYLISEEHPKNIKVL